MDFTMPRTLLLPLTSGEGQHVFPNCGTPGSEAWSPNFIHHPPRGSSPPAPPGARLRARPRPAAPGRLGLEAIHRDGALRGAPAVRRLLGLQALLLFDPPGLGSWLGAPGPPGGVQVLAAAAGAALRCQDPHVKWIKHICS